MQHQKNVFRCFGLPVSTFDYLKQFQRAYEQGHKVRLTNSQTLAIILQQHKEQRERAS